MSAFVGAQELKQIQSLLFYHLQFVKRSWKALVSKILLMSVTA